MFKTKKGRKPTNINENNKSASISEKKNSNCLIQRTEGGTSNITKITNQASDRNKKPGNGRAGSPTIITKVKSLAKITNQQARAHGTKITNV